MMGTLIRTDGTTAPLPSGISMREIRKMIEADGLDTVTLHHLGRPLQVMLVDDAGWETEMRELFPGHFELVPTKARKPINAKATELYHANCMPNASGSIVGDVVVICDDDYTP